MSLDSIKAMFIIIEYKLIHNEKNDYGQIKILVKNMQDYVLMKMLDFLLL